MTGVEAVGNGVSAFRDPAVKCARRTLTAIVLIPGFLARRKSARQLPDIPRGAGFEKSGGTTPYTSETNQECQYDEPLASLLEC